MHYSAEVAVVSAVVSIFLLAFCLYYLWRFDRFASLAVWRADSLRSLFRRSMILIYFIAPPMFAVSNIALAAIKYRVGFLPAEAGGNPVPYPFWTPSERTWVKPSAYMYSTAWIAEVIVHVEETCFWWYLLHLEPSSTGWFFSGEVKVFLSTSFACVSGILIPTILKRDEPFMSEAIVNTVGSLIILTQNLVLAWVVYAFKGLLLGVRASGNEPLLSRLTYFHELNKVRLVVRWLFAFPMLVLGLDGLLDRPRLNTTLWVVDLLCIVGLFAFMIQAGLTFLVFLPFVDRRRPLRPVRTPRHGSSFWSNGIDSLSLTPAGPSPPALPTHDPFHAYSLPTPLATSSRYPLISMAGEKSFDAPWIDGIFRSSHTDPTPTANESVLSGKIGSVRTRRPSLVLRPKLHPSLSGFKSPIDVAS